MFLLLTLSFFPIFVILLEKIEKISIPRASDLYFTERFWIRKLVYYGEKGFSQKLDLVIFPHFLR